MDDEGEQEDTHRGGFQTQRLIQLQTMPPGMLGTLIEQMHFNTRLPRLQMHFRQHGHEFGARSAEEYDRLFQERLTHDGLQRFTFIRPETGDIRWHLVEPATGNVAVYNETRNRYWSFFRNRNIPKFLSGFRGH